MRDTVELGATPVDEDCVPVRREDYDVEGARRECREFKQQLIRHYRAHRGDLPEGLTLRVKSCSHDFNDYFEVVASYDDQDEASLDAAFWLQDNLPLTWDDEAKSNLERAGHTCQT